MQQLSIATNQIDSECFQDSCNEWGLVQTVKPQFFGLSLPLKYLRLSLSFYIAICFSLYTWHLLH